MNRRAGIWAWYLLDSLDRRRAAPRASPSLRVAAGSPSSRKGTTAAAHPTLRSVTIGAIPASKRCMKRRALRRIQPLVLAGLAAVGLLGWDPLATSACTGRTMNFATAIRLSDGAIYSGRIVRADVVDGFWNALE